MSTVITLNLWMEFCFTKISWKNVEIYLKMTKSHQFSRLIITICSTNVNSCFLDWSVTAKVAGKMPFLLCLSPPRLLRYRSYPSVSLIIVLDFLSQYPFFGSKISEFNNGSNSEIRASSPWQYWSQTQLRWVRCFPSRQRFWSRHWRGRNCCRYWCLSPGH